MTHLTTSYNQGDTSDAQDEYSRYCNEPILSKAPPHLLLYWNAQVINTPPLAQMALDFLSIPAMSAECERVFSSWQLEDSHLGPPESPPR